MRGVESNRLVSIPFRFLLSPSDVGMIVGRNGTQISQIKTESEANLMILSRETPSDFTEKIVEITGDKLQRVKAFQMCLEKVAERVYRDSQGSMVGHGRGYLTFSEKLRFPDMDLGISVMIPRDACSFVSPSTILTDIEKKSNASLEMHLDELSLNCKINFKKLKVKGKITEIITAVELIHEISERLYRTDILGHHSFFLEIQNHAQNSKNLGSLSPRPKPPLETVKRDAIQAKVLAQIGKGNKAVSDPAARNSVGPDSSPDSGVFIFVRGLPEFNPDYDASLRIQQLSVLGGHLSIRTVEESDGKVPAIILRVSGIPLFRDGIIDEVILAIQGYHWDLLLKKSSVSKGLHEALEKHGFNLSATPEDFGTQSELFCQVLLTGTEADRKNCLARLLAELDSETHKEQVPTKNESTISSLLAMTLIEQSNERIREYTKNRFSSNETEYTKLLQAINSPEMFQATLRLVLSLEDTELLMKEDRGNQLTMISQTAGCEIGYELVGNEKVIILLTGPPLSNSYAAFLLQLKLASDDLRTPAT